MALLAGQPFLIMGQLYQVKYVNAAGAFVVPARPVKVTVAGRTFEVEGKGMMISSDAVATDERGRIHG